MTDKYEIWRDVVGYEGLYQVSNKGNVKALSKPVFRVRNNSMAQLKEKTLRINLNVGGYAFVRLYKNGCKTWKMIHRLVAEAFTGSLDGKQVNHKNRIKTDNSVCNLEIVSCKENILHYWGSLDKKELCCMQTGIFYRSINEAAESVGLKKPTLANMLYGKRKNRTSISFC